MKHLPQRLVDYKSLNMDVRNVVLLVVLGVIFLLLSSATPAAVRQQRAAAPIHILIVLISGLLALFSVTSGILAIAAGSKTNTECSFLDAELSAGDVGIALIAIGLLITYFTTRSLLKSGRNHASVSLITIQTKRIKIKQSPHTEEREAAVPPHAE